MGVNFLGSKPLHPQLGDVYVDQNTYRSYIWEGNQWVAFSTAEPAQALIPTEEELNKHPALKQAWEEYMVIKRLIGSGK